MNAANANPVSALAGERPLTGLVLAISLVIVL
jgi:hypothetical protein